MKMDFYPPSFYCKRHPNSKFNKVPMVAIKTAEGRKTLNDREYKEFGSGGILKCLPELSNTEIEEILKKEFVIEWNVKN